MHFCAQEYETSTPQPARSTSCPPSDVTVSTMDNALLLTEVQLTDNGVVLSQENLQNALESFRGRRVE